MKNQFLIALCIALAAAASIAGQAGIADQAGATDAPKPAWKKYSKSTAVSHWTMCRMLLAERKRLVPSHGADYFKPAKQTDLGKLMITTVGPAGGSKAAIARFGECLRNRDLKEAGRIIDLRQVIWLEPGREVVLEELSVDGIATILPKDGFLPMYVFGWSIKRAE